jgi:transposase
MRRKSGLVETAERHIKDIRRATRKRYSTEEKIRIVLSGLRGEDSIAGLCRREGIAQSLYYSWSKGRSGHGGAAANNSASRRPQWRAPALK